MQNTFKIQKQMIIGFLALLITADLALAAYSWRLSSLPHTPKDQLTAEQRKLEVLRADIRRAEEIKEKMPATQRDCDKFEQSLRPADSGYSGISAEIGAIASKAALQMDDIGFKQKAVPARSLESVDVDATVNGDYASVVKFLNGLQRSENVYEVEGLSLTSDAQKTGGNGPVRVVVHMRTYFRTV
jgi:Tfp pilus assembly protein PilO